MAKDINETREELRQLAEEIEDAERRGHVDRLHRMQAAYCDVVYTGRQFSIHEMVDNVIEFLNSPQPGVHPYEQVKPHYLQYPSLMDYSNGKVEVAAGYVVFLMRTALDDGHQWSIKRTCGEAERAFASITTLNGEDRFTP